MQKSATVLRVGHTGIAVVNSDSIHWDPCIACLVPALVGAIEKFRKNGGMAIAPIISKEALYGISIRLLESHGHFFVKIEPHESIDPEGADQLWLSVEVDDFCEGEMMGLSPLTADRWYVCHDIANKYGGWPTVWSFTGTESELVKAVAVYLDEKQKSLRN